MKMRPDVIRLLRKIAVMLPVIGIATSEAERDAIELDDLPSNGAASKHFEIGLYWNRLMNDVDERLEQPPFQRVLCAFGSVVDQTCFLDPNNSESIENLRAWIEKEGQDSRYIERSASPQDHVTHPEDIIELLRIVFDRIGPPPGDDKSGGGKSEVKNVVLRQALLRGDFPFDRPRLGGLAAIISDSLRQFGVDARHYSLYHSKMVSQLFYPESQWLNPNSVPPMKPTPTYLYGEDHPTRYGIALAFMDGKYPFYKDGKVPVGKSDRQLLVLKNPLGDRAWQEWKLEESSRTEGPYEWPNPPAFLKWRSDGAILHFEPLEERAIKTLGEQHEYVVISAPQLRNFKAVEPSQHKLLESQLKTLRDAGAVVHLELSGEDASGSSDDFRAFLANAVDSVGINSTELPYYAEQLPNTGETNDAATAAEMDEQNELTPRLHQALKLARALNIERLYVHGNDIDFILRRDASDDAMEMDFKADVFAKLAVLAATILRNSIAVEEFINQLPTSLEASTIKAYRDGMKARLRQDGLHESMRRGGVKRFDFASDYSLALVPCTWLPKENMPRRFSSTGAGDITSGFSFVYSGFHSTCNRKRASG